MKIVFMGTPDFSARILETLINSGFEIPLVLTMPDKARGRGYEISYSPVKQTALKYNIEVVQNIDMKDPILIEKLKKVEADFFVVVAYGKILKKEILSIPKKAAINIHASLLPMYRGAAPIQWAIIDGLKQTGISTMLMDEGLDTGDILQQYKIDINPDENSKDLFDRLSFLASDAILDTLENYELYYKNRIYQGDKETKYAKILKKEDGLLDFSREAIYLERLIRGLNPWPVAFSYFNNKILKIWKASLVDEDLYQTLVSKEDKDKYGKIIIKNSHLYIICKDSILEVLVLQLEGKKKLDSDKFICGQKFNAEIILGR